MYLIKIQHSDPGENKSLVEVFRDATLLVRAVGCRQFMAAELGEYVKRLTLSGPSAGWRGRSSASRTPGCAFKRSAAKKTLAPTGTWKSLPSGPESIVMTRYSRQANPRRFARPLMTVCRITKPAEFRLAYEDSRRVKTREDCPSSSSALVGRLVAAASSAGGLRLSACEEAG
jgi:hypothetical protein